MYSQKWNCAATLFPKQNYNALSPNFHIHVSGSNLYILRIGLPLLLQPNRQTDPGNKKIAHRYMSVGIGNEAVQYHFWECINLDFRYCLLVSQWRILFKGLLITHVKYMEVYVKILPFSAKKSNFFYIFIGKGFTILQLPWTLLYITIV